MTHKSGVVTTVHDNRIYQGQPSKYPNYKIVIGDDEYYYYGSGDAPCKAGDTVSLQFYVNKKNGRFIVSNDFETGIPKFQVMPKDDLDDPIVNDKPAEPTKVDTSFNPASYERTYVKDNKSMEIFAIAMTKSALESNQLKADKDSIAKFIVSMIQLYKESFEQ